MEPIQNNTEVPQIIENSPVTASNRTFPVFIILSALVIFVSTAAILFFNYQYTSKASYKEDNNVTRLQNKMRSTSQPTTHIIPSETPTPASEEESAVDNVTIDDGSSDFTSLDQTAAGL